MSEEGKAGRLYTCDLICAGVPSPGLWADFTAWMQERTGKRLAGYAFRPKDGGLALGYERATFQDGTREAETPLVKTWRNLYGSGAVFRPSCHACAYTTLDRVADVTIGDFWGSKRVLPGFDDGKGVSEVLVCGPSTEGPLAPGLEKRGAVIDAESLCVREQPALSRPHAAGACRPVFWHTRDTRGFKAAVSELGFGTVLATVLRKVRCSMRKSPVKVQPHDAGLNSLFDETQYETGRPGYPICEDPLRCTGCTACMAACPKSAITFLENKEGFLRPVIDEALCVECGRCRRACPSNGDRAQELKRPPRAAFAFKHNDDVRSFSSSGGAFWALALPVINDGGVVYGAAFDEDFTVRHIRCEDGEQLKRCCGSKYVQSDMGDTFRSVKTDLDAGRNVLFTGTPCQVAGLRSYLAVSKPRGGGYDNLIAIDLLCHGAASPGLFGDHVAFLESRHGKLASFSFRDKGDGWHHYRNLATFADGSKGAGYDVGAYQEVFNFSYAARPVCASCPYAALERVGDLTLGDCWGIEGRLPSIDDDRGVSLVYAENKRAESLMRGLGEGVNELGVRDCLQGVLRHPCAASKDRRSFWEAYSRGGYLACIRRFTSYGLLRRSARTTRKILRKFLAR